MSDEKPEEGTELETEVRMRKGTAQAGGKEDSEKAKVAEVQVTKMSTDSRRLQLYKVTSLVTLTVQNALLGLSMRYARTREGPMFLSSTAVVMSELVKLVTCLYIVYKEHDSVRAWRADLYRTVIANPVDTIKVSVPSLVYIIQNNLLYVSASHLDAATYQVTYQLKILTTAVFAVLMLKRRLSWEQWSALVLLVAGVAMVQVSGSSEPPTGSVEQNRAVGFSAALAACVLSGFAGIYFEKILKGSEISVWMRNVQLSLLSLPFGLATCLLSDWTILTQAGWFYGYDLFIFYLVLLQAGGGMVVAVVVKYADNILKGFATSLAIVISCLASVYLFDFRITFMFTFGAMLVIGSIFLYSKPPKIERTPSKTKITEEV